MTVTRSLFPLFAGRGELLTRKTQTGWEERNSPIRRGRFRVLRQSNLLPQAREVTGTMSRPSGVDAAIGEVLRGNRDAFRRLVEAYALPLRSYLASQVYRIDGVDDLAQEVFIAAYRSLDKFRPGEDFA